VILPTLPIDGLDEFYSIYEKADLKSYSSEDNLMSKDDIKKMLYKGGFLS
jgi:hypothetical protein